MNYFTIVTSEQELNIIGAGLGKLPYEVAEPIIRKLREQAEQQTAQVADTIAKEETLALRNAQNSIDEKIAGLSTWDELRAQAAGAGLREQAANSNQGAAVYGPHPVDAAVSAENQNAAQGQL